MVENQEVANTI